MKHHITVGALIVLATLVLRPTAADAQIVHMNSAKKKQFMLGLVDGAQQLNKGGHAGKAKLACFSAVKFFMYLSKMPMWLQRNGPAVQKLAAVCNPLYKNHPGDANDPAAIQKHYGAKLHAYGLALRFPPVWKKLPGGSFADVKRVVDSPNVVKEALPYAVEYISKMPGPAKCMTGKCPGVHKTWPDLVTIIFSAHASKKMMTEFAIPMIGKNLKTIERRVNKRSDGSLRRAANDLKRWVGLLRQAKPDHPGIAVYRGRIKSFTALAEKIALARLRAARMPKDKFVRGNRRAISKAAARLWQRRYKDKVLRVVIRDEEWSAATWQGWQDGKVWKWAHISQVRVAIAIRQRVKGKTSYRVFPMSLGRQRKAGGGWSLPYISKRNYGYPILKKNIHK